MKKGVCPIMATYNPNKHVPSIYRPKVTESDGVQQEAISNHETRIQSVESSIDDHGSRLTTAESEIVKINSLLGQNLSAINVTFYVCPSIAENSYTYTDSTLLTKLVGNDATGDGSMLKPFASIDKAMAKLRTYRATGIIVYTIRMHAGIYEYKRDSKWENGNYKVSVSKQYMDFALTHIDCTSGSKCYIHLEGYEMPNCTGNIDNFDKPVTLGDGYVLQCPVKILIEDGTWPVGGYAPFKAFASCKLTGITFEYKINYDKNMKKMPMPWGFNMYNGDSGAAYSCKFINFPYFGIKLRNPSFNDVCVNAYIYHCYFDNEGSYNMPYEDADGNMTQWGGVHSTGLVCDHNVANTDIYIYSSTFKYLGTTMNNVPHLQTFMPAPYKQWQSGAEPSYNYPVNVIIFDNCSYSGTRSEMLSTASDAFPAGPGHLVSSDIILLDKDDENTEKKKLYFQEMLIRRGNFKCIFKNDVVPVSSHQLINNRVRKFTNLTDTSSIDAYAVLLYEENGEIKYRRNRDYYIKPDVPKDSGIEYTFPETGTIKKDYLEWTGVTENDLPAIVADESILAILNNLVEPKKQNTTT